MLRIDFQIEYFWISASFHKKKKLFQFSVEIFVFQKSHSAANKICIDVFTNTFLFLSVFVGEKLEPVIVACGTSVFVTAMV